VCIADQIIAQANVETPKLDTVSYYDDDEPNWNERPYFSLVEQQRGREGYHIDVGGTKGALEIPQEDFFFPLPGYDRLAVTRSIELNHRLSSSHSRVLLRGIGGDEFLGGRPTAIPELQDLATHLHGFRFARQLSRFSLDQRRPCWHLAFDAMEEFLPQPIRRLYKRPRIAPWLTRDFTRRNADVFWADAHRTTLFGPSPSFQSALATLDHLRRQLNCYHLEHLANRSNSYPYLDRDLLVFLLAVPREQLVRPGQRRSLMRRSLASLVPSEILRRKRKAYVRRRPLTLVATALPEIHLLLQSPRLVEYGWVDPIVVAKSLESARQGRTEEIIPLLITLKLELWLRSFDGCHRPACCTATADTSSERSALDRADSVC
jgi:asparagine synthase (glutamine-hydrolysing)